MKQLFYLVLPVLTFTACSVDNTDLETIDAITEVNAVVNIAGCDVKTFKYEMDGTEYGHIEVTNDNANLYVTMVGKEGLITEARLQVAKEVLDFVLNTSDKNLKMNNIPKFKFEPGVVNYTWTIPFSDLKVSSGEEVYVLSRATINVKEIWAGDLAIGQNSRVYFAYTIQTCRTVVVDGKECEGTYMEGNIPFNTISGWNENNWGWAHEFNASIKNPETWNLYAGAAHNNTISKGKLLGSVTITFTKDPITNFESGTVSFDFSPIDGYLGGYKAFVGNELPVKHASGQYGNNRLDDDGKFFVIVKADICKN